MRVIGTAGHVDHGKSTLVRALTGIDPDRLREEKARGMTIDLGFAWTTLPAAAEGAEEMIVGIVDVPGHIDFIKNMLAGVGGIDAALLVISADEGVMPQTREHLAILDMLHAPTAVVALNKVDLIDDPEWLDLVEADIVSLLEGTTLADAPIVRVSARSGDGLDHLREVLAGRLQRLQPRADRARPRLPIDRVFTLSGFGVVVTGTLLDGRLQVGDQVEILPQRLPARVRGLQSHGKSREVADPGSRVAINLAGVEVADIHRGNLVAHPGTLEPTSMLDVEFRLLATAPGPLRHNAPVELFCGSSETPARVRVLGSEQIAPGQAGWLQLRLERPIAVAVQDRFILRAPSPSVTLGGGQVLATHPARRWRRFDPATVARFETLARGDPEELLLEAASRSPFSPAGQLAESARLPHDEATALLGRLTLAGALRQLSAGGEAIYLAQSTWRILSAVLEGALDSYHAERPLRPGMPRNELRNKLASALRGEAPAVRTFSALLDIAQAGGLLVADETTVRRAGFEPQPTPVQMDAVQRLLALFDASPLSPPNLGESLEQLGGDTSLLEWLTSNGTLVRLSNDVLFRSEVFDRLTAAVREALRSRGSLTLGEARDLLGTSRKYVQALMEELDARRVTRREGDTRVLR